VSRYADRIERGMAYLDETTPDWWKRIDLDRLRMFHCLDCIIGQLCGSYSNFLRQHDMPVKWLRDRGFVLILGQDPPDSYPTLTAGWKAAIRARRETIHGG
jgi:hypothetical protein